MLSLYIVTCGLFLSIHFPNEQEDVQHGMKIDFSSETGLTKSHWDWVPVAKPDLTASIEHYCGQANLCLSPLFHDLAWQPLPVGNLLSC